MNQESGLSGKSHTRYRISKKTGNGIFSNTDYRDVILVFIKAITQGHRNIVTIANENRNRKVAVTISVTQSKQRRHFQIHHHLNITEK